MLGNLVRVFRTPHSERFLLQGNSGRDIAALDLHYLASRKVAGTLIVLEDSGIPDETIPDILKEVDEKLLPDVAFEERNLSFTVVVGRVLGEFLAEKED